MAFAKLPKLSRRCLSIDDGRSLILPSIFGFFLQFNVETGSDFSSSRQLLRFGVCAERACGNISITNDEIMEDLLEEFTISLESANTDSRVRVSAQPSTARITDDDGMPLP